MFAREESFLPAFLPHQTTLNGISTQNNAKVEKHVVTSSSAKRLQKAKYQNKTNGINPYADCLMI
jgi:hypothetical protein